MIFNLSDDYDSAIDHIESRISNINAKERCDRSWKINGALRKIINNKYHLPFRYGDGPEHDTWNYLSLHMNHFIYRLFASNMWLFKRLISSGLIDASQVGISISCK